eukprot:CAMPEP_0114527518 /NCGR_PEP_ID=MMETSP0109-20121206/23663_1 /TAXON_ID=29199 /ORGANISM="Chlorarachnion reptans, Strain CCCM449" /LENGTH=362 /DNA_ID=CAMNT_0001709497 /DNA_START=94 /DNA_END=1181 /DNA_ORIENTATION=-
MSASTAYVSTVDAGLWEAAACNDIELIMMMPSDSKKRTDVASCVEEVPFSVVELLPSTVQQHSRMILYILLYLVAGPALIMCNKHLVKDIGFKFPDDTLLGSVIVFVTVKATGAKMPNKDRATWKFLLLNILPMGGLMALKMILGMKSFLYLTVSFIQMFKAFTPAITLFVLFITGVERPSRNVTLSVLAMCVGMLSGELNFSLIGIVVIFAAQLSEALRLMLMQKFIKKLNFKAIELQYYRAPSCALVLLVAAATMEFDKIWESGAITSAVANGHFFLLQAFLGFSVNIVNTMVIKYTNSVTLKVLAVVRNACLVIVNMIFFGEVVTSRQFMGYGVLLVSFAMFQRFRRQQALAEKGQHKV